MRNEICKVLIDTAAKTEFTFFTADLGFMALEPLRATLGKNFINTGISEQNMISIAAGVAYEGLHTFVYSIAPFCYARPFEQIRNDVCLNSLPVNIIGNGGGYAYGSMGATHHALEDYGVLSTLQNMHIFVPAFADDVKPIVKKMLENNSPNYLRLGRCELPKGYVLPEYSAWRKLLSGHGAIILCMGPLVGGLLDKLLKLDANTRPELWVVTELPLDVGKIPTELLESLNNASKLIIIEEHVKNGGFGQNVLSVLHELHVNIPEFIHLHANGYLNGTYGSQVFHRKQCALDPDSILNKLNLNISKE